jgi:hypothetical protein
MKKLKATIDKNGGVSIEAVGFQGTACSIATAKFSALLGQVVTDEKKAEFFQNEESNYLKE